MEHDMEYDIVFMDIVLGKENGIDMCANLIKRLSYLKVVFITGYIEYVEDIFNIEPFALLVKPINTDKLENILKKAFSINDKRSKKFISLNTKEGTYKIDADKISYIESVGRYLIFTDTDKKQYKCIMTMDEAEKILKGKVEKCHRSYFININNVEAIKDKAAHFGDGNEVPISRGKYKEIYNKFMNKYSMK
jgi:DNA-binding LytR/AlgR family response regulator